MSQLSEYQVNVNRCANDFYATRQQDVERLLDFELHNIIGKSVWECACGMGHISKTLINHGINVYSSDIVDYGFGHVKDFLVSDEKFDVIITNPPYGKYMGKGITNMAEEFVKHALDLVPDGGLVIMLLRTLFLEGIGRYNNIFSINNPRTVYVFSNRICGLINGHKESSKAMSHSWFVWQKGYKGDTILKWI